MNSNKGENMKLLYGLFVCGILTAGAAELKTPDIDVTAKLQNLLDTESEVVIPARKQPYQISKSLHMKSNQKLLLKPGAVLEAAPDKFHGRNDEFLKLTKVENVVISGYGAEIRMRKKDYQDIKRYSKSEWRHGIAIRDSKNVEISGITVRSTGGDGLYVGTAYKDGYSYNITVRDAVFDDNHRQGISIISVEKLLVDRCILSNTSGTDPEAGIDFEPNSPGERLIDCVVRDTLALNNRSLGFHMWLKNIRQETPHPVSIRFERCVSVGGACAAHVGFVPDGGRGKVEFVDCQFVNADVNGIRLRDKDSKGAGLVFRNCQISGTGVHKYTSRRGKQYNLNAPVAMFTIYKRSANPGGVVFDNLLIYDTVDRPSLVIADPIDFASKGFADVSGTVWVNSPAAEPVKLYGTEFNGAENLKLQR